MLCRHVIAAALFGGIAFSAQIAAQEPSPNELVQQVVDNELKLANQDQSEWMFRQKMGTSGEIVEVVETKACNLTRVVARDGKPLAQDQQASEDRAMEKVVNDPAEQQKRHRDQDQDVRKFKELFQLLPKALTFAYAGHDEKNTTLSFKPNSEFHPTSHEARVFSAMEGELIFNTQQKRVVEFRGHLTREVRFGIFGGLNPGGTFDARQEEVGPGHWEVVVMKINMRGKALFFKTINARQDESDTHFQQVPENLTLSQAADLLKKQDVADLGKSSGPSNP